VLADRRRQQNSQQNQMKQTGVLQIASRSKYFSTDLLVRRKPADQSQQNKNGTKTSGSTSEEKSPQKNRCEKPDKSDTKMIRINVIQRGLGPIFHGDQQQQR
jgi:hypothetical protein